MALKINQPSNLSDLRHAIRTQRSLLSLEIQHDAAAKVATILCNLPIFKTSKYIAIYHAFNNEIETQLLIKNIWHEQKKCYLPVIKNKQMFFIQYKKNDQLIKNKFGIFEPPFDIKKIIKPNKLDLVIVPIVGFDEKNNRLGTGGGYYDKTFAFKKSQKNIKPYLIGIAYELQKLPFLLTNAWDVPMNMIVTEKNCYS